MKFIINLKSDKLGLWEGNITENSRSPWTTKIQQDLSQKEKKVGKTLQSHILILWGELN